MSLPSRLRSRQLNRVDVCGTFASIQITRPTITGVSTRIEILSTELDAETELMTQSTEIHQYLM
jgi:hypothetical protein